MTLPDQLSPEDARLAAAVRASLDVAAAADAGTDGLDAARVQSRRENAWLLEEAMQGAGNRTTDGRRGLRWRPRARSLAAVGATTLAVSLAVALAPDGGSNGDKRTETGPFVAAPFIPAEASAAETLRAAGQVAAAAGSPALGDDQAWHSAWVYDRGTPDGAGYHRERWVTPGREAAAIHWSPFAPPPNQDRTSQVVEITRETAEGTRVMQLMRGGDRVWRMYQVTWDDRNPFLGQEGDSSEVAAAARWLDAVGGDQDKQALVRATDEYLASSVAGYQIDRAETERLQHVVAEQLVLLTGLAEAPAAATEYVYGRLAATEGLTRLPNARLDGQLVARIKLPAVPAYTKTEYSADGMVESSSGHDGLPGGVIHIDYETGRFVSRVDDKGALTLQLDSGPTRVDAVGAGSVACQFAALDLPCTVVEGEGRFWEEAERAVDAARVLCERDSGLDGCDIERRAVQPVSDSGNQPMVAGGNPTPDGVVQLDAPETDGTGQRHENGFSSTWSPEDSGVTTATTEDAGPGPGRGGSRQPTG